MPQGSSAYRAAEAPTPPAPLEIRPPSIALRAALSLALLLGFYLATWGLSLILLVIPVAAFFSGARLPIFLLLALVIGCWTAAGAMIVGSFSVRPVRPNPNGPRLVREDAPDLFDMIDQLAAKAGTDAPTEVFLSPAANVGVFDRGGLFSRGRQRVLLLGMPLLATLGVEELRAVLAHEMGHFFGGDTRLSGITAYTVSAFSSVAQSARRRAFSEGAHPGAIELGLNLAAGISSMFVQTYATVFFWIMGASSRRQEIAADAFAASLTSPQIVGSALVRSAVDAAVYGVYMQTEVSAAVGIGAMPSDVLPGFALFRRRFLASEAGGALRNQAMASVPEMADSHPSLLARLAALRVPLDTSAEPTGPLAITLLPNAGKHDQWMPGLLLQSVEDGQLRGVLIKPWDAIRDEHTIPLLREKARRLAERLHPSFPTATDLGAMLAEVEALLSREGPPGLLRHVEPRLPVAQASALTASVLLSLLEGTLVEKGAEVILPGPPGHHLFVFEGEEIAPLPLVTGGLGGGEALVRLRGVIQRLSGGRPALGGG